MSYQIDVTHVESRPVAVVRAHVEPPGMAEFLGGAFGEVVTVLGQEGLDPTGPPFGRYVPAGAGFDVEAGFPTGRRVAPAGRVVPEELPGGTVAHTLHTGTYDTVGKAYEAVTAWLADHGFEMSGVPWESYLDGPDVPQPRTQVFFPCTPTAPTPS